MSLDTNQICKNLVIHYLYTIIGILIFFSVFYWYEKMFPFNYLILGCLFFNLIFLFFIYKLTFQSIKLFIPAYFLLLTFVLYPFVFILWEVGQITAFIWYLLIPLGTMLIFSFRIAIYWSIYIFALIVSILILTELAPTGYHFSQKQLFEINIFTLFSSVCFILIILFYVNKLFLTKNTKLKTNTINITNSKIEIETKKYFDLYNTIVEYFETQKPYRNPDFNITQLAYELGTNITYISKALNSNKNMNYNIFVNTYRINEVKEMMEMNYHNKYTLKFIYTSAGFKHQSTFNKIFKLSEGVTPSDYIKEKYGNTNQ